MSVPRPLPPPGPHTPAWAALQAHWAQLAPQGRLDLRSAFLADAERFARFSQSVAGLRVDWSKQWLLPHTQNLLLDLAHAVDVPGALQRVWRGDVANPTEGRTVGHLWQRVLTADESAHVAHATAPTEKDAAAHWNTAQVATKNIADADVTPAAHAAIARAQRQRQHTLALAAQWHARAGFTDVIHIGIGGSDLGPQMVVKALAGAQVQPTQLNVHWVGNVDGHELAGALARCQPHTTLLVVASKTFGTAETLRNLHSALQWLQAGVGANQAAQQWVAITANPANAQAQGAQQVLSFDESVGGRTSVWSAIGFVVALVLGPAAYLQLLGGASAMDAHALQAEPAVNLPLRLGALDVWLRSLCGLPTRCVAPYHSALNRLPAYLQQLDMESNGKGVDLMGQPLRAPSAAVLWGEPGTNAQHAFFQMLHQGTDVVPVEFIVVAQPSHGLHPEHHEALLANALAQSQALLRGSPSADGHRHFEGNRPSTTIVLPRLDAWHLGALIALYEHRVIVAAALWGLNPFDQFGVELGKVLARDLQPRLQTGNAQGLDASTAGLLGWLRGGVSP
jgi:glucose-6-phosphate isomerase